ncbi:hypothetical protein ABNG39_10370 [Streptococcus dysgalactiae]|uniref:Uncharacterized protein n=1 Tax=Streptococcus iniae TaxID=1346 RepID=A0A3L8GPX4_STRIN|nr:MULTISPECIES: hypothetical protein [Streptococcus]RLU58528.1 hypothetical protein DIY07_02040 [Streptococcus iniae]WCE87016.1 hypothetical protein PMN45_05370 [Streptococcus dysgalactiae]WCN27012.1 hypothetical protein PP188_05380 [Streptococcus dysgalactiae]
MRKDTKMNAYVTKSGYKYYTPRQRASEAPQAPKENKWKKGLKWLGQALLAGLKNLPSLLIKVAITPVFLLLFIVNLIKSLIATAIGWFVFKVAVGFVVICYWAFLTKEGVAPASVETWFHNWIMPAGVPIHYWWETTIIVVLAIITALSLTFYSDEA